MLGQAQIACPDFSSGTLIPIPIATDNYRGDYRDG